MMPIDSNQQTVQAVTIMRQMITPVTAALMTNSVETTVSMTSNQQTRKRATSLGPEAS